MKKKENCAGSFVDRKSEAVGSGSAERVGEGLTRLRFFSRLPPNEAAWTLTPPTPFPPRLKL